MSHPHRIEYWLDETSDSDYPTYCVSLCDDDGDEICCLDTDQDEGEARAKAVRAAVKRDLDVVFRHSDGTVSTI